MGLSKKADWRGLCCDLLMLMGSAAVVVGAFLLHPAAGCFALGGALIGLSALMQRSAKNGERVSQERYGHNHDI